jgi:uncharacterized lipoprotein YajG
MRSFLILVSGLFLLGCSYTQPVVLLNPKTGSKAQCGPYDNAGIKAAATAMRESQCIEDYKQQGFVRQ